MDCFGLLHGNWQPAHTYAYTQPYLYNNPHKHPNCDKYAHTHAHGDPNQDGDPDPNKYHQALRPSFLLFNLPWLNNYGLSLPRSSDTAVHLQGKHVFRFINQVLGNVRSKLGIIEQQCQVRLHAVTIT